MIDHLGNTLVEGDTVLVLDDLSAHLGVVVGFSDVMLRYVDGTTKQNKVGSPAKVRNKMSHFCVKLGKESVSDLPPYKKKSYEDALLQAEIELTKTKSVGKSNIAI
jgi:hypothetical protein